MTQLSPAERYTQSRQRTQNPHVNDFRAKRTFDLDPFQVAAAGVLESGKSVLVAAPTGAGKTVVAEFAVYLTMQSAGDKLFYTTPMKALSNQKYNEFVEEWGAENVGILTGDTNINSDARIVVMTTEVLRNMLYANSEALADLRFVVMDEVHYLADKFRGAVWEEVIIHLPEHVRLVSLSATVSNAEEFGDWLQAVRGDTEIIVSEDRPIPLDQHVLVGNKFIDLFDSASAAAAHRVNPELLRLAHQGSRTPHIRGARTTPRISKNNRHNYTQNTPILGRMDRSDIIEMLGEKNLLPAIFFVFSRAGCDQAVQQVLRAGITLTTSDEAAEIRDIVDEKCRAIADEDLGVLGYWEWLDALERGVGAHHAGLLPIFKEVVEELYQRRLVKVVFATETLALGINMPARTVVLEKLDKYNGEARVPLTPGEYTQLTGRAGRRGIDVEGHSLIQWSGALDPTTVASLASKRTYPLNSSFRPTYNMAINLIEKFGRSRTREILESSFAQFQADLAVVDLARKVRQQDETLAGYAEPMSCHLGNFVEYSSIRRELSDVEKSSETGSRASRDIRSEKLASLRKQMKNHSCHHCPDREQHARWAERWWRLNRDNEKIIEQIQKRTNAVARVFDSVCDVLVDMDYLARDPQGDDLALTPKGEKLGSIYGERDLLVAEAIRLGLWDHLDVPALAAIACSVVFEPRRDEGEINERHLPRGSFLDALHETQTLWSDLEELETYHQLPSTSPLATGLSMAMYKWAKGSRLNEVLIDADMPAGDFVRWSKQTIDLLDQLSQVASGSLKTQSKLALEQVKRGIVAYGIVS